MLALCYAWLQHRLSGNSQPKGSFLFCILRRFTFSHGLIGPAVKLLFYHYGLTLKDVNPTGPKNNVLKRYSIVHKRGPIKILSDVMRIIEARHLKPMKKCANEAGEGISSATTPPKGSERFIGGYIDIPLNDMRNSFAKRLSRSKVLLLD